MIIRIPLTSEGFVKLMLPLMIIGGISICIIVFVTKYQIQLYALGIVIWFLGLVWLLDANAHYKWYLEKKLPKFELKIEFKKESRQNFSTVGTK